MEKVLLVFLIAFSVAVLIGKPIIKGLQKLKAGQNILNYVELHKTKQGTPTMGGSIFLIAFTLASICFMSGKSLFGYLTIAITFGYGLVGFLDDFIKVKLKRNLGLAPYQKILGQGGLAIIAALFVFYNGHLGGEIVLPFTLKEINIGFWIVPLVIIVFIACTNSVNLTDGLDGLAGGVSVIYVVAFTVYLWCYYGIQYTMGANIEYLNELLNLVICCSAMAGGLLGFLVFNSHKAQVFMGDAGSLAIGGFIASVGVFSKLEIIIPFLGIMFVISAISVILQVLWYKKTKKRIFLMAPLHHHFEQKGVNESKIVSIYMIITVVMGAFCILFTIPK